MDKGNKKNNNKDKMITTKRITRMAIFIAIALILSLLESFLPPLIPLAPNAKMGLSNVAVLTGIILLGYLDATIIQTVRLFMAGVFAGNISALMYSVPAGIMSLIIMSLLYRFLFPKISLMGISFCGAIVHNMTQVFIASIILNVNLVTYLPIYILFSIGAGLFIGILSFFLVKHLPKSVYL